MGMTIDENIQGIQIIKAQAEWDYPIDWQIVLDGAIENMQKYQMFQTKYIERLKADLVAILTDLQLDIEEQKFDNHIDKDTWNSAISVCSEAIQEKINALTKDCRDCSKWENCPCGKQGHENETSLGYSIGECKDFQDKINALKGGKDG